MGTAPRDRVTLALTLFFAGAAVIGQALPFAVGLALWLLAIFFFFWGRTPESTEAFVGSLPAGIHLLAGLRHLDAIISPRDPAQYRFDATKAWLRRALDEGAAFSERAELPAMNAWAKRTRDFINAAFGAGEAAFFMDDSGLEFRGTMEGNFLKGRMRRLRDLIQRIDKVSVAEDFDPALWERK